MVNGVTFGGKGRVEIILSRIVKELRLQFLAKVFALEL